MNDTKRDKWRDAMVAAGHRPVMCGDGFGMDIFAYEMGGYHNGPACSVCGWGTCWHCDDVSAIPTCIAAISKAEGR